MFVIVGLVALMGCILAAFTMEGGKPAALMQIGEFIIIGGAGISSLLASSSPKRITGIIKDVMALLKPDPYNNAAYLELMQLLYEISNLSRRDGLLALESHVERPQESDLFQKYPLFSKNHHAINFVCDSLRLVIMGGVGTFELQELMDNDIEVFSEEVKVNSAALSKVGDAMPGFGIVAAVLGVVITMGAIGGPPEQIGEKVGAALVGTFLGILLSYGIFGPVATAMETRAEASVKFLTSLKCGLVAFAQGMAPMLVVEFARRSTEDEVRPSFQEVEGVVKGRSMASSESDSSSDSEAA